MITDNKC